MIVSQILASLFVISARTSNWLLIRKHSKSSNDPFSFNALVNAGAAFVATIPLLLFGVTSFHPEPKTILLVIAASSVMFLANLFRVVALKHIDVSIVSTLGQISLLVSTFVAFAIGAASYNHLLGIGIFTVFTGNILLFFEPNTKNKWIWNKYLGLSIAGAICLGLGSVIYDSVKQEVPVLLYILFSLSFQFMLHLLLPQVSVKKLCQEIKNANWKLILIASFWYLSGTSVIVSIKTMGIVMGVIVANFALVTITLSSFLVLHEKSRLLQKLIAAVIVFIGTVITILNK